MEITTSLAQWISYFEKFGIDWFTQDGTVRFACFSSPHWEFFGKYDEDDDYFVIIYPSTPFDEEVIEYTESLDEEYKTYSCDPLLD